LFANHTKQIAYIKTCGNFSVIFITKTNSKSSSIFELLIKSRKQTAGRVS